MKASITIERSTEWLRAERLRTGENVPERISIRVDLTCLSEPVRAFLLAYSSGEYLSSYGSFCMNWQTGAWNQYGRYSKTYYPHHDGGPITIEDVDAALRAMIDRGAAEREELSLIHI